MKFTAAVVGAGRQGLCAAYDLARLDSVGRVRVLDRDGARLEEAASVLEGLGVVDRCEFRIADAAQPASLPDTLRGVQGVFSSVPFRYGFDVCKAAVEVGAHAVDLGGNLDQSARIHGLAAEAKAKNLSVAPDCGLMPGLGNVLGAWAIAELERQGGRELEVELRCGGLPQTPRNALGYELVFSFDGLINEYDGQSMVVRDGGVAVEPTLEDIVEFTHPRLGELECATTSGGTSTAPETFARRVKTYRYKTVRYRGHFTFFRTLKRLGGFAPERRAALRELLEPALAVDEPRDLVLLRVDAVARSGARVSRELLDLRDAQTGFTAMERTTAFPAVAVLELAMEGSLPSGGIRLERDLPVNEYLSRVARRGIVFSH